jgi:hypothetical protein
MNNALDALFSDSGLETVWRKLARKNRERDELQFIIATIINAVDCAPPEGNRRVTRDRPDAKVALIEQQKKADKLVEKAAKKAHELATLLTELNDIGGQVPVEATSSLGLIQSALEDDAMASACCLRHFVSFEQKMSSYEKARFPKTAQLIEALDFSLKNHLPVSTRYANNPWLSSSHSSWIDCLRVLRSGFSDCADMYGYQPELTPEEWRRLLKSILGIDLSLQGVRQALLNA